MCFEKLGDYPIQTVEKIVLIGKDSDLELLRKTPKSPKKISDITKDDLIEGVNVQIAKITSRGFDKGDKL